VLPTCHFRLQSQDTCVECVIAFSDEQLVPQESAQRLGNQARQHTQAPSVPKAVVDPKTTALAARSAVTPQAAALQSGLVQSTTPRSREEIRKLFTRRSSSLQPAASLQQPSTNLHGSSHPASRLQHHSGPARLEPVLPETASHFQPVLAPQPANQLPHSHHAVSGHHEVTMAPALGNQAPGTFGQYAYPGSSHQNQRASGQSFHQSQQIVPQRNSAPPQRTSGSSHSNLADASAVARPSMSSGSGPTMRAEVLMGPGATIEVNVRFHANIAAALKRYAHTSVNSLAVNITYRSVYGYLAEPLMQKTPGRHSCFIWHLLEACMQAPGSFCCCTCFSGHKCSLYATCTKLNLRLQTI